MKIKPGIFLLLIALLVLGSACARSPYDLTLGIVDVNGSPIPGALVTLGDDIETARAASETGEVIWTGLEESTITLTVSADQYVSKVIQVSLERGHNETVVVLDYLGP